MIEQTGILFSDKGLSRLNAEKYDTINFSETFQNGDMDFAKLQNGTCKNANCIIINNTDSKQQIENKEEYTNVYSKKNDYQAIVDCWNEYNGKSWGKVLRLGAKRKRIIKSALDNQGITQEELMRLVQNISLCRQLVISPNKGT